MTGKVVCTLKVSIQLSRLNFMVRSHCLNVLIPIPGDNLLLQLDYASQKRVKRAFKRGFMCHQCWKSDKSVVNCSSCNRKRYCVECLAKWLLHLEKLIFLLYRTLKFFIRVLIFHQIIVL